MAYVITVLVLAALITLWAYSYSKWGKGRGCCRCAAPDDSCCQMMDGTKLTVSAGEAPPSQEK